MYGDPQDDSFARGDIASPADFLKSIGRDMDTKLTVDSWDELWQKSTKDLKAAGMGIRDRRCVYTLVYGEISHWPPVQSFAHPPPPKKKIRGWGPAVQNGKRIRSKVQKTINKAKAKAQSRQ
ncbi:hypothetical protein BDZ89DRAFT_1126500 [Hymenopellis radicata]|nr:hypothetical protein BDZ89DRAFT_1126500 [Hymenopellis radicata]